MFDHPAILLTSGAYLLLVLAIGVWAARRTRDAKDFFLAGQAIGLWVTGFATMSAAFSGFVFIGGPGLTYRLGLASLFICLPASFTAGLLCWTVAKRLRLLAQVREVYTVPDALLCRYGSPAAAGLGAVAVLLGTIAYLGAQLQALGVVLQPILGLDSVFGAWSPQAALALGVLVVTFYAVAGGMVAGVYTDLLQGILMVAAAVAVFLFTLRAGGGLGAMAEAIAASPSFGSRFLDPLGTVPLATAIGFFFVFGVGTLGQPHMLHKFYMLDDVRKLRYLPLLLAGSQLACVLLWLGIGLVVPALVARGELAPLAHPDEASPAFLLSFAPPWLAGLAFAAVLAAIMSTADSFLNIASAALVRDLPRALGRRPVAGLAWARGTVLGVAVGAAFFAHAFGDLVALLGTFAFSTFAAALAPALAVGLNWKGATRQGAVASLMTGLGVHWGLEAWSRSSTLQAWWPSPLPAGVLPGFVALAASFLVLIAVSALTASRPGNDLPEDVAAVMEL